MKKHRLYNLSKRLLSLFMAIVMVMGFASVGTESAFASDENDESSYEQDVYSEESTYEEPVYEEPAYEEPAYEEPVYEEPEPGDEEPVNEEPVIDDPSEPVDVDPEPEEPAPEDQDTTEPADENTDGEAEAPNTDDTTLDESPTEDERLYENPEVVDEEPYEEVDPEEPSEDEDDFGESDPYADLESSSYWMSLFEDVELTGIWADDLITIAESQLDYTESKSNFIVVDGEKKGYTRFGAWYGIPYGDWCAMFVSFCLCYAEIPSSKISYQASCPKWVSWLDDAEMFVSADEDFIPSPGDLIFFDYNYNDLADHVGIVYDLSEEDDGSIIITTIEGNTSNMVRYREYSLGNKYIFGYGILPKNPDPVYQELNADVYTDDTWAELEQDAPGMILSGEMPEGAEVRIFTKAAPGNNGSDDTTYVVRIFVDDEEFIPEDISTLKLNKLLSNDSEQTDVEITDFELSDKVVSKEEVNDTNGSGMVSDGDNTAEVDPSTTSENDDADAEDVLTNNDESAVGDDEKNDVEEGIISIPTELSSNDRTITYDAATADLTYNVGLVDFIQIMLSKVGLADRTLGDVSAVRSSDPSVMAVEYVHNNWKVRAVSEGVVMLTVEFENNSPVLIYVTVEEGSVPSGAEIENSEANNETVFDSPNYLSAEIDGFLVSVFGSLPDGAELSFRALSDASVEELMTGVAVENSVPVFAYDIGVIVPAEYDDEGEIRTPQITYSLEELDAEVRIERLDDLSGYITGMLCFGDEDPAKEDVSVTHVEPTDTPSVYVGAAAKTYIIYYIEHLHDEADYDMDIRVVASLDEIFQDVDYVRNSAADVRMIEGFDDSLVIFAQGDDGWYVSSGNTAAQTTAEITFLNGDSLSLNLEFIDPLIEVDVDLGYAGAGTQRVYLYEGDKISAPTRDGYTFIGWRINESSQTEAEYTVSKADVRDGVIRMTAVWSDIAVEYGTLQGETNDAKITVSGMIPVGARLSLDELTPEAAQAMLSAAGVTDDATSIFAYDISILLPAEYDDSGDDLISEEREWQPEELGLRVTITGLPVADARTVGLVHVLDDADSIAEGLAVGSVSVTSEATAAQYASSKALEAAQNIVGGEADVVAIETYSSEDAFLGVEGDTVSFEARSFSAYVLYTVDFHYGKRLYQIEGGSSISLSELFDAIYYTEHSAEDAVSVVFSDPTLLQVEQLKNENDWLLTSLAPFSTPELLTITFADGDVLEIEVSDDPAYSVQFDINYDPTVYTNGTASVTRTTTQSIQIEENSSYNITLPTPDRVGYTFTGWQITTGTGRSVSAAATELALTSADATNGEIKFVAQWSPIGLPFSIALEELKAHPLSFKVYSSDGSSKTYTLDAMPNVSMSGVDGDDFRVATFSNSIRYDETLSEFFTRVYGGEVTLVDKVDDGTRRLTSWQLYGGTHAVVDQRSSRFALGDLLDAGTTDFTAMKAFVNSLQMGEQPTYTRLYSHWGAAVYTFTATSLPATTKIFVDGVDQSSAAAAGISMALGTKVQIWLPSSANYTRMYFEGFRSFDEMPRETGVDNTTGSTFYVYSFDMPNTDISATYTSGTFYTDIAQGSITFVEGQSLGTGLRSVNGFWYKLDGLPKAATYKDLAAINKIAPVLYDSSKGYFFIWNTVGDLFYITSQDVETQNQLTLVNNAKIRFKYAFLAATNAYSTDFVGRKCGSKYLDNFNNGILPATLTSYGSIIIARTYHVSNTVTLYIDGTNSIASIVTDTTSSTDNAANKMALDIYGPANTSGKSGADRSAVTTSTADTLRIGSIMGNIDPTFYFLNVSAYGSTTYPDKSDYGFYNSNATDGNTYIRYLGCKVELPLKRFFGKNMSVRVGNPGTSSADQSGSGYKSEATLGSAVMNYGLNINSGSYVHVLGSLSAARMGVYCLYQNSVCVVEGGVYRFQCGTNVSGNINNSTLIVKGGICDFGILSLANNGIIVANSVGVARFCNITGGTIIANAFGNTVSRVIYNTTNTNSTSTGDYTYGEGIYRENVAYTNGQTYVVGSAATDIGNNGYVSLYDNGKGSAYYKMTGGSIYLLGGYVTTSGTYGKSTSYMSGKTITSDNPLYTVINDVLGTSNKTTHENATKKLTASYAEAKVKEASATYGNRTCMEFGVTALDETVSTNGVVRRLDMTGGNIYAAGHIVICDTTNISGSGAVNIKSYGGNVLFTHDVNITNTGSSQIYGGTVGINNTYLYAGSDGLPRYRTLNVGSGASKFTIQCDRLGSSTNSIRSTMLLQGGTYKPKTTTNTSITVSTEQYVNYFYDGFDEPKFSETLTASSSTHNPRYLHFYGTAATGTTGVAAASFASSASVSLTQPTKTTAWADDLTFVAPTIGETKYSWALDSAAGSTVSTVSTTGLINGTSGKYAWAGRTSLNLYAAKTNYSLTLKDQGVSAASYTLNGGTAQDFTFTNGVASVPKDSVVTLTPSDPSYAANKKIVVWYKDGSGALHNAKPTFGSSTVSFTMPANDTDVWITNEITLDIYSYEITFTNYGFRTDYSTTNSNTADDTNYIYNGDIRVTQSNIKETQLQRNRNNGNGGFDIWRVYCKTTTNNSWRYSSAYDYTTNRFSVVDGFAQGSRKITFNKVYTYEEMGGTYGLYLNYSGSITITIDGPVMLGTVYRGGKNDDNATASITFVGKNGTIPTNLTNVSNTTSTADSLAIAGQIGYVASMHKGKGTITFKDLFLAANNGSYYYGTVGTSGSNHTVVYDHSMILQQNYAQNNFYLAYNVGNVKIINNSYIDWGPTYNNNVYNYTPWWGIKNLTIDASTLKLYYGNGLAGASQFYDNVSTSVTVSGDATVTNTPKDSTDLTRNEAITESRIPATLTVKGAGTSVTFGPRARLKKLVVQDGASVTMTDMTSHENDRLLEAYDISVTGGASLSADYVVVSGYYQTTEGFNTQMSGTLFEERAPARSTTYFRQNGTFTMSGATTKVTAKFIGGDFGTTNLNVQGGTLNVTKLGTYGALFGYLQVFPTAPKTAAWFSTYERLPDKSTTVNITGGTVNLASNGYIGGMYGTVKISGGAVNVGDGAVIGVTDAQAATLLANGVSTGYSTVTISGGTVEASGLDATGAIHATRGSATISGAATAVKLRAITAARGTVSISDSVNHYDNTGYPNPDHTQVGVFVSGQILAQNVSILNKAVVWANNVYSEIPEGQKGSLTVQIGDASNRAYLYSTEYTGVGEDGYILGENDWVTSFDDDTTSTTRNVFSNRYMNVNYVYAAQEDVFVSQADINRIVKPDNPEGFQYSATAPNIVLQDPSCEGYVFLGWYEAYDEETGEYSRKATQISQGNRADLTLYAIWQREEVVFEVSITMDGTDGWRYTSGSIDDGKIDLVSGSHNNGTYVYKQKWTLKYGETVRNTRTGVNLDDLTLAHVRVESVDLDDSFYSTSTLGIYMTTTVSLAMVNAYKAKVASQGSNAALTLKVSNTQWYTEVVSLYFYANQDENGRPTTFSYVSDADPVATAVDNSYIMYSVNTGAKLGDGTSLGVKYTPEGGLPSVNYSGYSFQYWEVKKSNGEKQQVTADNNISDLLEDGSTKVELYANWVRKEYNVSFSLDAKDDGWVTDNAVAPAVDATPTKGAQLPYQWKYDEVFDKAFPYAWKEGYVFKGWSTDGTEAGLISKETTLLNTETFGSLFDDSKSPALTLYPYFVKATVTYDRNGGKWASGYTPKAAPDYLEALPAFHDSASYTLPSGHDEAALSPVTVKGHTYNVVSTSSAYYDSNKKYLDDDYRNIISRKGYTFSGWNTAADGKGTAYACGPRFEDVVLYAQWSANKYTLVLNNEGSNTADYVYSTFSVKINSKYEVAAEVGKPITASASNWPGRSDSDTDPWYCYNTKEDTANGGDGLGENEKRYFLGATFVPILPGVSVTSTFTQDIDNSKYTGADKDTIYSVGRQYYIDYCDTVVGLQNLGSVFDIAHENGTSTSFNLPETDEYITALGEATLAGNANKNSVSIPDYPNGSKIQLYALYREKSILFIERYKEEDGSYRENIVHSLAADKENFDNYPARYEADTTNGNYAELSNNYTLSGWYVNTTDIKPSAAYPNNATAYKNNLESWQNAALTAGTYDVVVYALYRVNEKNRSGSAQETELQASSITAEADAPTITYAYTFTDAVEMGKMTYAFTNGSGLKLVPVNTMTEHYYDSEFNYNNTTYKADETVAIQMTVRGKTGTATTYDLATQPNATTATEFGAGTTVTLTLYHSRVMSKDVAVNPFAGMNIHFTFAKTVDGEEQLSDQSVDVAFDVKLTPSLYSVIYKASIPATSSGDAKVTDWNGFSATTQDRLVTDVPYGSDLSTQAPSVEGYTFIQFWKGGNTQQYKTFLITGSDYLKDGTVEFSGVYRNNGYSLSIDANTAKNWDVIYTGYDSDANGEDVKKENLILSGGTGGQVPVVFDTVVQFKLRDGADNYAAPYIIVSEHTPGGGMDESNRVSIQKLSEYAQNGNGNNYQLGDAVLQFKMPALNIVCEYNDVETLYLDDGDITIEAGSYTQGTNAPVIWPGNYVIAQKSTAATTNTLTLSGQLTDKCDTRGTNGKRSIALDDLNVRADDSIRLADGTSAALTLSYNGEPSAVTLRNIFVPSTSTLSMETGLTTSAVNSSTGAGVELATLTLTPSEAYAGIGGKTGSVASGKIDLSKLRLNMSLYAPSYASGVGPGNQSGTGSKSITMTDCIVSGYEQSSSADQYHGAWFGGVGVPAVTLTNVWVTKTANSTENRSKVVNGGTVTLEGCHLGTASSQLTSAVYASDALNINNSVIYLQGTFPDETSAMLGAAEGKTVSVTGSTIIIPYGSDAQNNPRYTGVLLLNDDSYVVVNNARYIEAYNGGLSNSINTAQDNRSLVRQYILLGENTKAVGSVAIGTKGGTETIPITVQKPLNPAKSTAVATELLSMTVSSDTELVLDFPLRITGTGGSIQAGKTLTVSSGKYDTLTVAGSAFTAGTGVYKQESGVLNVTGTLGNTGLTVDIGGVNINNSGTISAAALKLTNCPVVGSGTLRGASTLNITGGTVQAGAITGGAVTLKDVASVSGAPTVSGTSFASTIQTGTTSLTLGSMSMSGDVTISNADLSSGDIGTTGGKITLTKTTVTSTGKMTAGSAVVLDGTTVSKLNALEAASLTLKNNTKLGSSSQRIGDITLTGALTAKEAMENGSIYCGNIRVGTMDVDGLSLIDAGDIVTTNGPLKLAKVQIAASGTVAAKASDSVKYDMILDNVDLTSANSIDAYNLTLKNNTTIGSDTNRVGDIIASGSLTVTDNMSSGHIYGKNITVGSMVIEDVPTIDAGGNITTTSGSLSAKNTNITAAGNLYAGSVAKPEDLTLDNTAVSAKDILGKNITIKNNTKLGTDESHAVGSIQAYGAFTATENVGSGCIYADNLQARTNQTDSTLEPSITLEGLPIVYAKSNISADKAISITNVPVITALAGDLYAGTTLTVTGDSTNRSQIRTGKNITAASGVDISNADVLSTAGIVSDSGNVQLANVVVTTTGLVTAGGDLTMDAVEVQRCGVVTAKDITLKNDTKLGATNNRIGAITASGNLKAVDGMTNGAVYSGAITLTGELASTGGTIDSSGAVSASKINVTNGTLVSGGEIKAKETTLEIQGSSTVRATGAIGSNGNMLIAGSSAADKATVTSGGDISSANGTVTIRHADVSADGDILAGTGTTTYDMTLEDVQIDKSGKIKAKDLTITKGTITRSGVITATSSLTASESTINSSGNITAQTTLTASESNLTASNITSVSDMTLTDSTVKATDMVGSYSVAGGVTTVKMAGKTDVTAKTVGALGEYKTTFISVEMSPASAVEGTLVRDVCRLNYDIAESGFNKAVTPTESVLRTSTTYTNGAASTTTLPDLGTATGAVDKAYWYVHGKDGNWYVLNANTYPGDFAGTQAFDVTMMDMVEAQDADPNDGTKQVTLYAWINPVGKELNSSLIITAGRKLVNFTSTAKEVEIAADSAWTAKLTIPATQISGRTYEVSFTSGGTPYKLPAGTDLTLTVINPNGKSGTAYYYYTVPSGGVTTVAFSDFAEMGYAANDSAHKLTLGKYESSNGESFLLSADLRENDAQASSGPIEVAFTLKTGTVSIAISDTVSYTCTAVTEGVLQTEDPATVTVSTSPSGGSDTSWKTVYLVGEFQAVDHVPYDARAVLGGQDGVWISGNQVAFALGGYGAALSAGAIDFSGLKNGTYSIRWALYAADGTPNILTDLVSSVGTSSLVVNKAAPSLQVNLSSDQRQLRYGTELTITTTYVPSTASPSIILQQLTDSGYVSLTASGLTVQDGQIVFDGTLPVGKYRIAYSINNDSSSNDDVVYTFVVWGDETDTGADDQGKTTDPTETTDPTNTNNTTNALSNNANTTGTGRSQILNRTAILGRSPASSNGSTTGTDTEDGNDNDVSSPTENSESIGDDGIPRALMEIEDSEEETLEESTPEDTVVPDDGSEDETSHGTAIALAALAVGAAAAGGGIWLVGKRKSEDEDE